MVGTERRSLESVYQNVREIIPTLGFLKPLGRHASGYRTKHLMIWYREQRKRGHQMQIHFAFVEGESYNS